MENTSALAICFDALKNKTRHAHYDRVTELARLYTQLITGEDQESLLQTYFKNCDAAQLKKIKDFTTPITSAVCASLSAAFKKVLRTRPILKQIDFNSRQPDKAKSEVEARLANYFAGKDLDCYIRTRFHALTMQDPNAFIVTEFKPFDNRKEKANPYPYEVPSHQAINFGIDNGNLTYLLTEQPHSFSHKGEIYKGIKLTMYLANNAITVTQVPKTFKGALTDDRTATIIAKGQITGFVNDNEQYIVEYYTHNTGMVPAIRVGYVADEKTQGQTFVSPIHYGAVPYLKKSIKTVAEMDLTTHLHTFPQKLQYIEPCAINAEGTCSSSGEMVANCKRCGGSGYMEQTSAKDVIKLKLPRDKEQLIDLSRLIHYAYPPIQGIQFQKEYVEALKAECYKGVFNSEVFSKDEVQSTATGKNIDLQNVYDTLYDYAEKVAEVWVKTVTFVSIILDYRECNHQLVYPSDFKLKSITELLSDLQTASSSGAPAFVKNGITADIAGLMYQDRPNEMLRYQAQAKLYPFTGLDKDAIAQLISGGYVRKVDITIYAYFGQLMNELDDRSLKYNNGFEELLTDETIKGRYLSARRKSPWYFDLPFDIQKALLHARAEQMMIEETEPATV